MTTETSANGAQSAVGGESHEAAPAVEGKSIILFSDGTGNSSAKLFKTNVWRMYEAVDLGPPAEGKRDQIAYYDDGVGTSSFKPLAVLGGAFGWGLKRNVLDIYRLRLPQLPGRRRHLRLWIQPRRVHRAARRGADRVARTGALGRRSRARSEEPRGATARSARDFLPRRLQWPTKLARRVRDGLTAGAIDSTVTPVRPRRELRPNIRFVGVWDTVAAYGGPITEITRAIDNWIFPLSMPDYQLERARAVRAPRPGAR